MTTRERSAALYATDVIPSSAAAAAAAVNVRPLYERS